MGGYINVGYANGGYPVMVGDDEKRQETHKRRRNADSPALIPRLHHRRINPLDGAGQAREIAQQHPMHGEVRLQDVEEGHEARGDVLGLREGTFPLRPGLRPAGELPEDVPVEHVEQGRSVVALLCESLAQTQVASHE